MTAAEEIFTVKSFYNKWLKELTEAEKSLIVDMLSEAKAEGYNEGVKDAVEKLKELKCPKCEGAGYTSEHDPMSRDEYGLHDCRYCPVQVQCEYCMGTGRVCCSDEDSILKVRELLKK